MIDNHPSDHQSTLTLTIIRQTARETVFVEIESEAVKAEDVTA